MIPAFRWQDPIAVTWDSDLFQMEDDSFYKIDLFDNEDGDGQIQSEESRYAKASSSGVTWYADLKIDAVDRLYGSGGFILNQLEPGSGKSTLYGHYIHSQDSPNLGISLGKFGSITVVGTGKYDEAGNQKTFNYS